MQLGIKQSVNGIHERPSAVHVSAFDGPASAQSQPGDRMNRDPGGVGHHPASIQQLIFGEEGELDSEMFWNDLYPWAFQGH
ncbi:hypothetical protein J108_13485 [Mycobacteroides abscessus subsp. bolletii CRM-0020]|uniref:Uncharacterized protein n=2 Tax=Mycobacteroides abscessus TaxID=36809 RepID=A0A829HWU4_9MYCO|nr:hypothetical protein A3N96_16240 [Mycobacteroides abscessus]EHC00835.1 hypothetical protein MAB47J26_04960 [Mycobacteroides abscessus 47J26]EPQ23246.1 hypothetical protein J108_13485 [Mycobacteroides abscessus subsp. bolletii CRM-0020]AMU36419.1 hypothetical protein A3N98_15430 [Mycobacteroides abscessus]AMU41467.1 hypothetical protein A3N99_16025 [Mycobacteroides abscessus]